MKVMGVEHVGITVPNVEEATKFFEDAFGAEVIFTMLDENNLPDWNPGADVIEEWLGSAPGAYLGGLSMLRLGDSANIELFKYSGAEQRPSHRPSDIGVQHFCLRVDDIKAAVQSVLDAGGTALHGPNELVGGEAGEGNYFIYVHAPWGMTIELIQIQSPMAFEADTDMRRWLPE
jgi:catechol 2,3-dioxygenase-like lactoylglutathione lyase family enzyme